MILFKVLPHVLYSFTVVNAVEKKCHPGTRRCYWVGGTSWVDWETARLLCQSQGGDLAVIEKEELWNFVHDEFYVAAGQYDFWVGLSDNKQESVFRWFNGDILKYNKWGRGIDEPQGQEMENDVAMTDRGLGDVSSSVWSKALCSDSALPCTNIMDGCGHHEKEPTVTTIGRLQYAASCNDAKLVCENEGKRLLTVRDWEKEQQVSRHHGSSETIWLGLTDAEVESVFRWFDGSVTTWVNWTPGQPDGSFFANCMVRQQDGKWLDEDCEGQFQFYCEKEEDVVLQMKTFEEQSYSKIITEHIINSKVVRILSECIALCIKEPMCQAFSLAENMTCVVGSSRNPDDTDFGTGVTYYNTEDDAGS